MKTINVTFEDREHYILDEMKDGLSWKKFILVLYAHAKKTNLKIIKKEVKNGIIKKKETNI